MSSAETSSSNGANGSTRVRKKRNVVRLRIFVVAAFLLLLLLIASLRGLAGFYTDYLWFSSLGFSSVWWKVLWAKVGLGLLFTSIFLVLMWINLYLAERLAPKLRPRGPEEDVVIKWHQAIGSKRWLVRLATSFILALLVGVGVSGRWQDWLFFVNPVDFGVTDQQFNRDVGFYIFRLPFLEFLVGWVFAAVLVVFLFTAIWYYLFGGIRLQVGAASRVQPQVKAHLSLLLGLLALTKAVGYYLDQFGLTLSTRGFVNGATYTDVNAQLPVLRLLMVISLFCFVLLVVNIWRRGFTYPVIAVGLWAVVAVLAGAIYPALIQRFQVEPSESTREAPFIERNIEMTRLALGLDRVQQNEFQYEPTLSAEDISKNVDTVRNVRLLDPAVMQDTFQQTQGIKSFYDFLDIDVDRYEINNDVTQVVLSARELNSNDLPNDSWESRNVGFTHGYGLAAAPANAVDSNGRPAYVLGDIPATVSPGATDLQLSQPGLYLGEGLTGYAVVGADRDEVDFQDDDDRTETIRYDGDDGVGLGSIWRRAAFALRFAEPNLLISSEIGSESRILFNRDVTERVRLLAPFLSYDEDPYPAVIDGEVIWIIDAYTVSGNFPYAQQINPRAVRRGDLATSFNYVRNSIKVTVDAYNGTVKFYVIDETDPLAMSYKLQFGELFADGQPPQELQEHFRYPEDLFRVQTDAWGRYRIDEAAEFYDAAGAWSVAQDPGNSIGQATLETIVDATGAIISRSEVRIAPQYLLLRLPGDDKESFVNFRPFVPFSDDDSRKNLEGFMVVHSDPDRYGEIEVFEIRSDAPVDGPALFNSNIQTEEEISERVTLLNQNGSVVTPGNLLLIPVENSLLYVRPLFIEATGTTAVPELQLVIVGVGADIVIAETFEAALEGAVPNLDIDLTARTVAVTPGDDGGDGSDSGTGGGTDSGGTDSGTTDPDDSAGDGTDDDPGDDGADDSDTGDSGGDGDTDSGDTDSGGAPDDAALMDLLAAARAAFDRADAALSNGDLAEYQREIEEARRLIDMAEQLLPAGSGASSGSPNTTVPSA